MPVWSAQEAEVTEISALYVLITVGALFGLLALGVWVGLALMGTAFVAMMLFSARLPGDAMATTVFGSLSAWTLTSLPLFIWMGEILYRSRVSESMFKGLAPLMALMPGRLVQVNVGASMVFAAISGSSAATCATVGRITIPELRKRNYPDRLVIGSLAGASTLGLLIPPSIIMIVYAVAADVSINKLFAAGVIPGIVFGCVLMAYNAIWSWVRPGSIPADDMGMRLAARIRAAAHLLPVALLIIVVLGSIYGGFATATESAAFGVVGAFLLSALERAFNWRFFVETVYGAMRTTTMILLIVAGAAFLSLAMGMSGIPALLAQWVGSLGLSAGLLLVALALFYILLGCVLDGISMVLLTMAIVLPMVKHAGIDLIWFGIFIVFVVEMAQITPPVGFNLFVLQNATGRDIAYVSLAALPYFLLMIAMLFVIWQWPGIVSWLPAQIGNP
jgi:tripartite ATP-independent transporter DctM subunit